MTDGEQSEDILKRAKLRKTPARTLTLGILRNAAEPMGAAEILDHMPPHMEPVTVYRTLNALERKAVVHRVRGDDRVWRYAISDGEEPHGQQHPHFICDECGRVECLRKIELPRNLLKSLNIGALHLVTYAEVILHGTCPKCQ